MELISTTDNEKKISIGKAIIFFLFLMTFMIIIFFLSMIYKVIKLSLQTVKKMIKKIEDDNKNKSELNIELPQISIAGKEKFIL